MGNFAEGSRNDRGRKDHASDRSQGTSHSIRYSKPMRACEIAPPREGWSSICPASLLLVLAMLVLVLLLAMVVLVIIAVVFVGGRRLLEPRILPPLARALPRPARVRRLPARACSPVVFPGIEDQMPARASPVRSTAAHLPDPASPRGPAAPAATLLARFAARTRPRRAHLADLALRTLARSALLAGPRRACHRGRALPLAPGLPRGPSEPGRPGLPCSPGFPASPAGPRGPCDPGLPCGPGRPVELSATALLLISGSDTLLYKRASATSIPPPRYQQLFRRHPALQTGAGDAANVTPP